MQPAILSLLLILILNAGLLLVLNAPASWIPLSLLAFGSDLRTMVIMAALLLPILTTFFLAYVAYYRVDKKHGWITFSLLVINGALYAWIAIPLLQVLVVSAAISFLLWYGIWVYYDRYLEKHLAAIEGVKRKLKLN